MDRYEEREREIERKIEINKSESEKERPKEKKFERETKNEREKETGRPRKRETEAQALLVFSTFLPKFQTRSSHSKYRVASFREQESPLVLFENVWYSIDYLQHALLNNLQC